MESKKAKTRKRRESLGWKGEEKRMLKEKSKMESKKAKNLK